MSAPPRPFLRRFTLALLGMLLLMAVVFTGLGWIVARDFRRVCGVIGVARGFRLSNFYLGIMATLMAGDRDADGVCDGVELLLGTDPRNSMSCPEFNFMWVSPDPKVAYCGERVAARCLQVTELGDVRWPRGFRALVSANEPILLPKDGAGPPTKGPLVVPVNESGEVKFDIMAESSFGDVRVEFGNAANNQGLKYEVARFPGWRAPPITASINGGPSVAVPLSLPIFDDGLRNIQWGAPVGWSSGYVIEAAREAGNGIWQPVHEVRPTETRWKFANDPWNYFDDYTGPLKFRVVPVSPTPPESSPPR